MISNIYLPDIISSPPGMVVRDGKVEGVPDGRVRFWETNNLNARFLALDIL